MEDEEAEYEHKKFFLYILLWRVWFDYEVPPQKK
jgi:hypothetical protein